MRHFFYGILLWSLFLPNAHASFLDDFDDLRGHTVIDAGALKSLDCPIGGQYDCLTWPTYFFQLNSRCFEAVGGYPSGYSLKALLTVGPNNVPSVFIVSGMMSSDFKRYGVVMYDCPPGIY